jgi:hypothetical protein
VDGSCEHGIEPSGSIKCWEVLEGLHNWRLLKKGSAAQVSIKNNVTSLYGSVQKSYLKDNRRYQ